MSDWSIIDLAGERDWQPSRLTLASFTWPGDLPLVELGDVTTSIEPDGVAQYGTPVITLSGFDRVTGALKHRSRSHQGLVYQVHERGRGLRPGDLLVPATDGPVLYVSEDLVGSLVSSRYFALRPVDNSGLWLWSVLNSRSGRTLRRSLMVAAAGPATVRVELRGMRVPYPPPALRFRLEEHLASIQLSTSGQEEVALGTWWTTANLNKIMWGLALSSPNPQILEDGDSLTTFCESIERGRSFDRRTAPTEPGDGLLPVASGFLLAGRQAKYYLPPSERTVVAAAGDVLVASIGERANARIADQPMIVGDTVYVLRLSTPQLAPALVHFLNGDLGLARRRMLLASSTVPRINLRDLRAMRVPAEALERAVSLTGLGPLDGRLEEILWPS